MNKKTQRKLLLFVGLTAIFSAAFHILIARTGTLGGGGNLLAIGLMWSPGVAALITQQLTEHRLSGLGWKWGKTRWQIWSILLPVVLITITYGFLYLTGLAGFPNQDFIAQYIESQLGFEATQTQAILIFIGVTSIFGMVGTTFTALGEEIGWRGLLVPELNKFMGFTWTSLVSGVLWAIYHFPAIIFADYNGAGPLWYNLICFTIMIISFSVVMTWFRLKSGSLWTAVFLHAAHNVFVQAIFTPLTYDTGPTRYLIDEFGAGLAITYLIAALIFWRLRYQVVGGKSAENMQEDYPNSA